MTSDRNKNVLKLPLTQTFNLGEVTAMKLEISLDTPHGAPEGVDINALRDEIDGEIKALGKPTQIDTVPPKKKELGDFSQVTWVVQHIDQIGDAARAILALVQAVAIASQLALSNKKKKPAPAKNEKSVAKEDRFPKVTFSLKTDKGEVRVERELPPLSDDEMKALEKQIGELLGKAGAAS